MRPGLFAVAREAMDEDNAFVTGQHALHEYSATFLLNDGI
jgi:hypothetical protein